MMPKLLLADDSITVQRVIALTFQGEGIEVIAVGDGDLAVQAIDRERPQIVLADLSMPGRDGYAVAEYVKRSPELAKDIRVVLLTGAAEPVEEARSRALGIDGVLSKPFEPHVATALVRRLLGEAPTVPGFQTIVLEGAGAPAGAAAPPPLPAAAPAAAGGSMSDNAIAVDDYFRRLDEALATAGLSTAPDSAGDLAAIAVPHGETAAREIDAETMIVARPSPPAEAEADGDAGEAGDGPKLVDAFSALLDAEEGKGRAVVAGPVEIDGAPAPVPPPAVEWTRGPAASAPAEGATAEPAPIEAAAETVAFRAVAAEAETEAEAADAVGVAAEPEVPAMAAEAATPAEAVDGSGGADVIDNGGATVVIARPLQVVPAASGPSDADAEPAAPAAPAAAASAAPASTAPAALRADVPDQAALDGIDLDVFADAVAQKILHRLTDARIDSIVSERVLEIAERLVREEIDRIKADIQ
jgi:CheY-like chemotaxis protein